MAEITAKDKFNARLKCLEICVNITSKHDIEKDIVIEKADKYYNFVVEPFKNDKPKTTTRRAKRKSIVI